MSTLADAQAKWERKTANAGARYDAAIPRMPSEWVAGCTRFGIPPGPIAQRNYSAGIQGGGTKLQSGVAGKGAKWAEGLRRGLSQ